MFPSCLSLESHTIILDWETHTEMSSLSLGLALGVHIFLIGM